MANVAATQVLQDGERNAIVKLTGNLDTSDEAVTAKVTLAGLTPAPTRLRIDKIEYDIGHQLQYHLLWDATTDLLAVSLYGSGCHDYKDIGGLHNNAGTGVTGTLNGMSTGWAAGFQTYTITLWLTK